MKEDNQKVYRKHQYFAPSQRILMEYTRFEKARIIGARALQISMGAPVIIAIPPEMIDPVGIATLEFEEGVIPVTVRRRGA